MSNGRFTRSTRPLRDCGAHAYAERTSRRLGTNPTYRSWRAAKLRCTDPRDRRYADYGGRGIIMCDRWLGSYAAFYDDMGLRPPGRTLDRIDNGGPYSPGNCRWATQTEQNENRRSTVWVEVSGAKMTLKGAAETLRLNYKRLHYLVRTRGITFDAALALIPPSPSPSPTP